MPRRRRKGKRPREKFFFFIYLFFSFPMLEKETRVSSRLSPFGSFEKKTYSFPRIFFSSSIIVIYISDHTLLTNYYSPFVLDAMCCNEFSRQNQNKLFQVTRRVDSIECHTGRYSACICLTRRKTVECNVWISLDMSSVYRRTSERKFSREKKID